MIFAVFVGHPLDSHTITVVTTMVMTMATGHGKLAMAKIMK